VYKRQIYASHRVESVPTDIDDLLKTAVENNARDHITGVLWTDGNMFIQVLEGERWKISTTYHKIAIDPRHEQIELISCGAVDRRLFEEWSMAYYGDTRVNRKFVLKYSGSDQVEPKRMSETSMLEMLIDLTSNHPSRTGLRAA